MRVLWDCNARRAARIVTEIDVHLLGGVSRRERAREKDKEEVTRGASGTSWTARINEQGSARGHANTCTPTSSLLPSTNAGASGARARMSNTKHAEGTARKSVISDTAVRGRPGAPSQMRVRHSRCHPCIIAAFLTVGEVRFK